MFISRRARDEFQFSLRDIREDGEREKEWAEAKEEEEGKQRLKRAKESESGERVLAFLNGFVSQPRVSTSVTCKSYAMACRPNG